MKRRIAIGLVVLLVSAAAVVAVGWRNARADPIVRRAAFALPGWPAGQPPVTVALLSDVHAGNSATPRVRLTRIVAQVNALRPDLVLIAGDFLPGEGRIDAASATAALKPLAGLRARLGVVAVPGNHDHWTGLPAIRAALTNAGVTMLANAVGARGPLAIGGVDDAFSGHADLDGVIDTLRRTPGARIVLTHSPDVAAHLPPDIPLLLAGHTHCGQVVVPGLSTANDGRYYLPRYRCGLVRQRQQAVVVTGGIGGTLLFRIGAPPDMWLLTLGPR